jgi:hypothetical protein
VELGRAFSKKNARRALMYGDVERLSSAKGLHTSSSSVHVLSGGVEHLEILIGYLTVDRGDLPVHERHRDPMPRTHAAHLRRTHVEICICFTSFTWPRCRMDRGEVRPRELVRLTCWRTSLSGSPWQPSEVCPCEGLARHLCEPDRTIVGRTHSEVQAFRRHLGLPAGVD